MVTDNALDHHALSKSLVGVVTAYYSFTACPAVPVPRNGYPGSSHLWSSCQGSGYQPYHLLWWSGRAESQTVPHLRSRQETGLALREAGVPVTEFRAAVISGSGSISFQMIRYVVERLLVMVCPKWIYSSIQPIAIEDLLEYMVSALNVPQSQDCIIEIGGKGVATYEGLMLGYAKARGLWRLLLQGEDNGWECLQGVHQRSQPDQTCSQSRN